MPLSGWNVGPSTQWSIKRERTQKYLDGFQGIYVNWKKPMSKAYILSDSIRYRSWQNYRNEEQIRVTGETWRQEGGKVCAHSCPTLCNPMNYSPLAYPVHGISQATILEWVAISFFRGSSWSRDQTPVSCVSWIAGGLFTNWAIREAVKVYGI